MWQSHFSIQQSHEPNEMWGTKMNLYNDVVDVDCLLCISICIMYTTTINLYL